MGIFKDILDNLGVTKSNGVFRTISSVLLVVSQLPIPALVPYQQTIVTIATWLGGLGVVKAATLR